MGKTTESAAKAAAPKTATAKKDPRKAAPVVDVSETIVTEADETATDEDIELAILDAEHEAEPVEVTRETWREFKEQRVTVHVVGVEEPFTNLELTGWSIKLLQFKDAEGKSHRLPATTVEKVTA
ncbi:hypothetical protein [Streptomyces turgidiscabies]|uniref:hypothetical protein n=1 Tax=Streptomyces turgidiscabies TaxID=85558 RepID=UPI0038F6C196